MGFNKLFWGLLFMIDFRIGGFDILPDIIGYILMLSGLNLLNHENSFFESGKKFTYPLIVLSIFDIFQPAQQGSGVALGGYNFLTFLIGLISIICYILLIYNICKGTAELAYAKENHEIAEMANKRWSYFLIMQIVLLFFFLSSWILLPLVAILFFPLFIGMIVVQILLMGLMKKAEEYL